MRGQGVDGSGGRRFRYAPTPSRRLHVGNGLAALLGWAAARRAGAAFVLRVEDIDRARCREEYAAPLLEDLRWLGLDWDEGPDVGGPAGPYRQSERLACYDELVADLAARGLSYPCVCSRAEIRAAQSAPHHAGLAGERPYPGTCRPPAAGTSAAPRVRRDRGGQRLAVAWLGDDAAVTWEDGWLGPAREDVRETCGDFLLGRPGVPTYQLAVVADDVAMGITDVVRGHDLVGSTARQILLHRALGATPPRFWHHPLIVDGDGRKLSKRDADLALTDLRLGGADPGRLISRLARSVGLPAPPHLTPHELIALLDDAPRRWSDGPLAPGPEEA